MIKLVYLPNSQHKRHKDGGVPRLFIRLLRRKFIWYTTRKQKSKQVR